MTGTEKKKNIISIVKKTWFIFTVNVHKDPHHTHKHAYVNINENIMYPIFINMMTKLERTGRGKDVESLNESDWPKKDLIEVVNRLNTFS